MKKILAFALLLSMFGCTGPYYQKTRHTGVVVEKFIKPPDSEDYNSISVIVYKDDSTQMNTPVQVTTQQYSNVYVGKRVTFFVSQNALDQYAR